MSRDGSFGVTRSATGRVAVLSLVGEHDLATAPGIRQALTTLLPGTHLVVVDLAETTFLESTVIGVLVAALRRQSAAGHWLVAVNAQGIVARALGLTGVADLLGLTRERPWPDDADLQGELQGLLEPCAP